MNKPSVTSADVAKLAGVSQSTVSRSFDPNSRISEQTRQRVFVAAEQLGYQVNKAAQTMIKQRSDLVGLVTAGLGDPFRAEFLHSLIIEVQNVGLRPMVIDVSDQQTLDSRLQSLIQYQLSGVIITSGTPSEAVAKAFIKRGTPVVLVNRTDYSRDADIVNLDNAEGGRLAAQAFLTAGKKHLLVVRSKVPSYSSMVRTQGFLQALAPYIAAGALTAVEVECESGSYDGGYQIAQSILTQAIQPDGIFFCMDHMACGFLDAAKQEFSLSIPQDMGVIGFDDIALASYKAYDLTTIQQSSHTMAQAAVQALQNRLLKPDAKPSQQTIAPRLIYRKTLPSPR